MEQYFSLDEVMSRLKISRDCLTRIIKAGKIPGTVKIGNMFRIPASGMEHYLAEQTIQPAKPFYMPRTHKSKNRNPKSTGITPLTMDIFRKD